MYTTYEYDFFADLKPANTNEAALITLSGDEELINCKVFCTNLDSLDHTVRVGIGTGASSDYYLVYDFEILANIYLTVAIPGLGNSKKIFVRTDSANNIQFSLSGQKKTMT